MVLVAIFQTDGYMRIQPAVQIIRDLSPRRWRVGGSVFIRLLKLILWMSFLWWIWTGLLFLNPFSIVISLVFIAPIAAIRLLSGLYVTRTFTTGTTADPRGESCVLWLVRRQCGSSNSVSDQVVSAAFKLDPKVFEQRGALTLVLSAILRPCRRQIQLSSQKQWVLDSSDERLLNLVGPLGCLLSKPSVAKLGPVIFVEDDDDKEIWSELCDRVWRMVVSKPHDESLLQGAILLLNSNHIIQWNINPPAFDTLTLLQKHTHESIQALSSNTLGTVPETTRGLHLAILASAYTIYLEYNGVPQEAAHDDILENGILQALINTMEERHQRGDDFYSERLLHLWLQRDPETVLPLLGPKAALFSKALLGLQRLDTLFWKFPGGPGRARRSDSLGLSTLHLLLTRDQAFWYVPLEEFGYTLYLQDILYAGRRLTSPQHLQLTLFDKTYETM
ncbi:hypothetical protein FRC02_002699 [Tulasnella sp. 418]|nr:hypothetical protein FRC02_002699 [Tulasnella sp. 418]